MLSKEMYTEKYIQSLHERTGNDPALLERVIYAFGLLEAIKRLGCHSVSKEARLLCFFWISPKDLAQI